jgi:rare lipoprotein A
MRMLVAVSFVWFVGACAPSVAQRRGGQVECESGEISYYAPSLAGNKTASGERYDHDALTAAHKTLPFGTRVRVDYRGKFLVLRINDRGPYAPGRILDVSGRAAKDLGLVSAGHGKARVCVD